jgi:hypothetical protein
MKVLMVNSFWDAANCSYRQAQAVNKYVPGVQVRHFRHIETYYRDTVDINASNYNRDEFYHICEESDIIHACSSPVGTGDFNFGFDWADFKHKPHIFGDYCSFTGAWVSGNPCWDVTGYHVWSSVPQSWWTYRGSPALSWWYAPDLVDETLPEFTPDPDRDYSRLNLVYIPSGGPKNQDDMNEALRRHPCYGSVKWQANTPNSEVLRLKNLCNLSFDCIWRGYHGATTVENLSLGIPTMCGIDASFWDQFYSVFQIDMNLFEIVQNVDDIVKTLEKYEDLDRLRARSIEIRQFFEQKWSAKRLAERMAIKWREYV